MLCALLVAAACAAERPVAVHEVHGGGEANPYLEREITLRPTVVTAAGERGFFVRSLPRDEDSDPATSESLYVYLGRRAGVNPGQHLRLRGRVIDFHGHTQLADPEWDVTGRRDVPPPVVLHGPPKHGWRSLESTRVAVGDAVVAEATDRHGNVRIAVNGERPYGQPGGNGAGRLIRMDPAGLGGEVLQLAAGSRIRGAGPLVFRHGEFTLWPQSLEVITEPDLPRPVREPVPGELTLASFNLRLFHDEHDDAGEPTVAPEVFRSRVRKLSAWLEGVLHCPDVVAVQEIESVEVLARLADATACEYQARTGERRRGPGLGYLVSLPGAEVRELGTGERLSGDGSPLFDRPPLELRVSPAEGAPVLVLVNVHLRSLIGIEKARVQRKRLEQAEALRSLVEGAVAETGGRVIVLGDFNAFEFSDGVVDVLARVTGARPVEDAFAAPVARAALLRNFAPELPETERYSYVHRGMAQLLDHVLVGRALADRVAGIQAARGNADAPVAYRHDRHPVLRASDHDPLVLYLTREEAGGRR